MKLDIMTVAAVSGLIIILAGSTFILNTTLRRNDHVGRLWSVAFVGGMLETLSYTVEGMAPSAWWAIAVGNGAFVLSVGMLWAGFRAANGRRSLYAIPLAAGVLAALAVLLRGPDGGWWAGSLEMFLGTSAFAALGFFETLRGWLARSVNARIVGIGSLIVAAYYLVRASVFLFAGPQSVLFQLGFGSVVASLVCLGIIVVGSITLSLLQAERFRRPGLDAPSDSEDGALLGEAQFRANAEAWLQRAVRDQSTLALVLVELANIDEINLAFGRTTGDNAIRMMGRLAVGDAPPAALVGRLGRPRFALLFHMDDEDDARLVADRINSDALISPIDDGDRFRVSAYIGITSTRAAGARYEDLLDTAEAVLELAVDSGRPGTVEYAA
jgi:diguanylate cyclase